MVRAVDELERGRESYAASAWLDAYESLSRADQSGKLGAEDLELLARSAYMVGNDDDYVVGLERAHDLHLTAGDIPRAGRCAFWIGHNALFRGQTAHATAWFGRAQRLLERDARDCVERGYLLIPVWLEQMRSGDYDGGFETAAQAAEIGERFGDMDLVQLDQSDVGREAQMYVVAEHRIKDAERFWPSSDRTEAVCLWEAGSVETVRDYLDSFVGAASENQYFQVSNEHAIGIPEPIGATR
jgi:hypothetical protein